jgi:sodium-dependent dicarboxylate transporter 2/3/5
LFALLRLAPPPQGMEADTWEVAALALLMAAWWLTEAVPLAVTALLPLVLLPGMGTMPIKAVAPAYANPLVFLFLGGFLIAAAIERWELHRRIALHTVRLVGVRADRLVLGFMVATALLSMWISNTASAMMMVAIAVPLTRRNPECCAGFGTALMLGIAYGASIGGVATLIGTPPNAILAGVARSTLDIEIGFARWMAFALPLSVVMLIVTWWLLTGPLFRLRGVSLPGSGEELRQALRDLGRLTAAERRVLAVFCLVAGGWLARGLTGAEVFGLVDDSVIALAGALLLFLLPSGESRDQTLLDWPTAARIPWDVLLLFGGGFALATAFADSGLTTWLAGRLLFLSGLGTPLLILGVSLLVVFLTEVTSNTATASLLLPVLASLAGEIGLHPLALMVPAALAASFAFMLPVATPPNAIVFGTRQVTVPQMARAGIALNLIGAVLLGLFVLALLPATLGVDLAAGTGVP